ncbi:MAG: hypothetical protein ACOCUQ_02065 [Bacteroidota bacterium]
MINQQTVFTLEIPMGEIKDIASKVVTRYILRSAIPEREKEDVIMTILEKFLQQKEKIDHNFEGKSKKTTYYIAIMNRMCCEIIRKEKKHWYPVDDDMQEIENYKPIHYTSDTEKNLIIKEEVKRLANAMLFFNGQGSKINLFVKYYFHIALDECDIKNYSGDKFLQVRDVLTEDRPKNKSDLFEKLAFITNLVEHKNVKGDAVRMWINKQLDVILKRINMNGIYNHTRESLQILMELRKSS